MQLDGQALGHVGLVHQYIGMLLVLHCCTVQHSGSFCVCWHQQEPLSGAMAQKAADGLYMIVFVCFLLYRGHALAWSK
jgi:hypothetical protein